MGDIEGLMARVKDLNMDEDKMMDDIKKGRFTLRNMYEQFQNIMKLGPISQVIIHTYIQLQRWIFLSQVMGMIPGLSSVFGGGQGGNGQVTFFWTFSSLISWFQGERPGEYEKTKASDDHHGQHERQGKSTTHNILIIIWTWLGTWRHGCFQDLHQTANKSLQNCLWSWCHGDGGYHF